MCYIQTLIKLKAFFTKYILTKKFETFSIQLCLHFFLNFVVNMCESNTETSSPGLTNPVNNNQVRIKYVAALKSYAFENNFIESIIF